MLDMGFLPDLKRIIEKLPDQRQSLFFSATLPPKITELAQSLLRDPVNVNVTPKSRSVERIEQRIITIDRRGKFPLLQTILESSDVERALVFTKTKRTANMLALQLMRCRINATAIHGNKSQNARQRALEAFRDKQVQVLVATDVAARGIDIDGITHVINYDLPNEPEAYVHRIGRTGRAGAEGIALSFCTEDDRDELRAIERLIGKKIPYDKNHSRPPRPEPKTSNGQRNRRNASEKKTSSRKPGSSQSNRRRNSGFVVNGEDKSKRKRRKVWPPKSRAKQTNN